MGMAASNVGDRIAASLGLLVEVEPSFKASLDVANGGVLFALPALIASGLFHCTEKYFDLPKGYYGLKSIFLLLAFMALARLKSFEELRYTAPGEFGKILGLDRVPEVRTLRTKVSTLVTEGDPKQWSAELCKTWMGDTPSEIAGALYIDGHVRVYHGSQTKLPRHYVTRQKLCLRATTDYWVNAMDGQPFFKVDKAVDPGLIQVLEEDIVPRIEKDLPRQPTVEELKADKYLSLFTMIFDREGYSPDFFERMWKRRIACTTYNKFPKNNWDAHEFKAHSVTLSSGNVVEMQLAERGTFLNEKLWIREIRKLSDGGHQVSILSTDFRSNFITISVAMFARWAQENFFRYMREHYSLDTLISYNTENLPDATKVVNPAYRKFAGTIRSKGGILSRQLAVFAMMSIKKKQDVKDVEAFQQEKAQLLEDIVALQTEIEGLKKQRKATPTHVTIAELPEGERFQKLASNSKHFIDTIKMIAYRAETAMSHILQEKISRTDETRTLLRAIYSTEADILPDELQQTLTVSLHHLANHCSAVAIQHLCTELNNTETLFPGTNLRLIYKLVSVDIPRDQEV